MKKIILILMLTLNTSQLYAAKESSCLDKNINREASYHVSVDPLTAIAILSSEPDCDDKYALMHRANVEIAKRCRMHFYYGNKINPRGWDKQIPNRFEKYVIENPEKFSSASEGSYEITPNNYWTNKIKNPDHPVKADFAYQNIKHFYNAVWEDGDGSRHSDELIGRFKEWIKKHPDNANIPEARAFIESMRNNYFGKDRRREVSPDSEILIGTWDGVLQIEDDSGNTVLSSDVILKISAENPEEGQFTVRKSGETWKTPVSIEFNKIVLAIRYETIRYETKRFILERAGQEYLISIKYKSKFYGRPSNNTLVLSREESAS